MPDTLEARQLAMKQTEAERRQNVIEAKKEKARNHAAKLREKRRKNLKSAKVIARKTAKRAATLRRYYVKLKHRHTQALRDSLKAIQALWAQVREASAKLKGAQDAYDQPREVEKTLAYARGLKQGLADGYRVAKEEAAEKAAAQARRTPDIQKEGRPWTPDSSLLNV
jgi:tRNA 2-selenouridine synthase SelU